ncbi:hypothetical protein Tter_1891 [Thermobaculum terrenum ATCC BAA-798]|uniref:Uncharacterized protein n=1 Tax=Thermobaculum terrenum (strain ATCC BAA-798 / CCMEE 7001 / YNP1) TaxID=525904 RepID=D1CGC6_THET1|nr:hypothetical protein Tter_1891 [Thermobaculum terrenum ATCC BAA-798]
MVVGMRVAALWRGEPEEQGDRGAEWGLEGVGRWFGRE